MSTFPVYEPHCLGDGACGFTVCRHGYPRYCPGDARCGSTGCRHGQPEDANVRVLEPVVIFNPIRIIEPVIVIRTPEGR
jgi:hypothetical protein